MSGPNDIQEDAEPLNSTSLHRIIRLVANLQLNGSAFADIDQDRLQS